MPITIIKDVQPIEVSIDELLPHHRYYYTHSTVVRELYDERYYDGADQNYMIDNIVEKHMYDENVQSAVIGFAKFYNLITSSNKKVKNTTWWFVTLTSKPDWTEIEAKEKIDKYRQSHFKKFPYMWVEEHGTESEKYHQHVLVDNPGRFHTGINLKPTKYYDANINI